MRQYHVLGKLADDCLRLRCDCRRLNSITIQDCHLLPKILIMLTNLGGNQSLSVLNQGKACHQIHLKSSLPLLYHGVLSMGKRSLWAHEHLSFFPKTYVAVFLKPISHIS